MRALWLAWLFVVATPSYHERRLYEELMRDYNVLERPVENHKQAVSVKLKVSLQQIIDVDEKNQVVNVNALGLDYDVDSNFDSGLSDKYAGNSGNKIIILTEYSFWFYNTGKISWVPPGIFKISCKIDIKWFPFDEQVCFLKFGSWTYDGDKFDLQPAEGGFDISEYLENGEWALPLTTVSRNVKRYDCCDEPYLDLTFYLHLRRRTLYYGFNLIMPCILTTMMTLLGFTLPPDAGEKITLRELI
ncbi:unnamed protein product, partial [Mesorhabditis belari]|uniref:Neurotransmitter-gated ion-channel ligand-binding domain-containing protein n=1 Tax=Mesorhabditis belari TaxID=2138241 RepID=A0AAF3FR68_9BILA